MCEKCDYEGDYERGTKMMAHINKLSFLVNPLDGGYFWQVIIIIIIIIDIFIVIIVVVSHLFYFCFLILVSNSSYFIFKVITGKEELPYPVHRQFLSFFGVLFSYKQSPFVKVFFLPPPFPFSSPPPPPPPRLPSFIDSFSSQY